MTIEDVLKELGIQYLPPGAHHHTTRNRLQIDCPWCSKNTKRWRMGVRLDNSRWCHCWVCGQHMLASTLAEVVDRPVGYVLRYLAQLPIYNRREADQDGARAVKTVLPPHVGDLQERHQTYLKKRGLEPYKIRKLWRVQGIGISTRLTWRLFIPITQGGELVSWTTRSISDNNDRPYLSAEPDQEKVPHKSVLYGEEYCRNTCIICEGPLDVWALGPGAVCTFGLQYTRAQVLQMSKFSVRVVCFDNEPDAQKVADELCKELSVFPGETHNIALETGKDPIRASYGEICLLRNKFLK